NRGDVFVLDDFLVQVTWRAVVEKFVAEDGRGDAGSREQKHVAQGLAEALGVPARSRRIRASREDGRSGEENVRSDEERGEPPEVFPIHGSQITPTRGKSQLQFAVYFPNRLILYRHHQILHDVIF